MADYEIEARITIWDFECPPDEISTLLGQSPDHLQCRGEIRRSGLKAKHSVWTIHSPEPSDNSSVGAQWTALANKLGAHKGNLTRLPPDAEQEMLIVVYAFQYMPDVDIPVEVMRDLTDLGLKVRVAIYDLVEEDDEDVPDG